MIVILVAGPAGGGKTTFAKKVAAERGLPLVSTDDFIGHPWDEVPFMVAEAVRSHPSGVVLEGVRALSAVEKGGLMDSVEQFWWAEVGHLKPGCDGMNNRQLALAAKLSPSLPPRRLVLRSSR